MSKQEICIGAFIVAIIGVVFAGPSMFAFGMVATFLVIAFYQPVWAMLRPVIKDAVESVMPPIPDNPAETDDLQRRLHNTDGPELR